MQKKKWKSLSHYVTYVVWCKGNSFQDCAIKSFLLGLCCTKSAQQPFTGRFYLQKVYIYRSTCYRAWFTQLCTGCYLWADMGCYLRVDSHSYGKISPRLLKERPHNLTKWTFLGTFTRHFAILRWKIGGKNSGAANVCVCRFLAGVVSALAQWIDVLQINHHWCPDTWHMIST